MAIFHFSAKTISRSAGRSAVAAAAYRAGECLEDERTGITHDYRRKGETGVDHSEIMAPSNAPSWARDRSKLWNTVEQIEKRKDSQLAREIEVSLPRELNKKQQLELAREFIKKQFVDRGMIADFAIHKADSDNPHVHIMLTMRDINEDGFGKKNRDWNDKELLKEWREKWEFHANSALEKAGFEERIDHRSLEAQGITDRAPGVHLGPSATAIERRGEHSEIAERARIQAQEFIANSVENARQELDSAESELASIRAELDRINADEAVAARAEALATETVHERADRLKTEIQDYKKQHIEAPAARLLAAQTALHTRSQKRELVEPAYRAVQASKTALEASKKSEAAMSTELAAMGFWRVFKRHELKKQIEAERAKQSDYQFTIDDQGPMSRKAIREVCEEAITKAQGELDQVQPGLRALEAEHSKAAFIIERQRINAEQAAKNIEAGLVTPRKGMTAEYLQNRADTLAYRRANPNWKREAGLERSPSRSSSNDYTP